MFVGLPINWFVDVGRVICLWQFSLRLYNAWFCLIRLHKYSIALPVFYVAANTFSFRPLCRTRRQIASQFTREFASTPIKKNNDHMVVIFLGGGGEIRTPATGLPVLTI